MQEFTIFTPSGILGYGYNLSDFWATITTSRPSAIIIDGGSTDPGPYMLGTGKLICSKQSYIRDLSPMLEACAKYGTKIIISSAGGAGTNAQVDAMVGFVAEIAEKQGRQFKVASIRFDEEFCRKVKAEELKPCGPVPAATEGDIKNATAIVAQMGAEPFQAALAQDVDIIIAGRAYDPAPFAAFSIARGVAGGVAWHMGKIMECGGLCAVPKGRSMVATMHEKDFILCPPGANEKCTALSVAAHTFYEKSRPDLLPGPGGVLHLDESTYVQLADERSVQVQGARFVPTPTYQVKLEGAECIGFRSVFIGGIRDSILIRGIDAFLESARKITEQSFPRLAGEELQLIFHVYGKNGVMGPMEQSESLPHELCILGEVVAPTQDEADAVAGFARVMLLHHSYEGQLSTGGNLALPLTPLELSAGAVFKFSLYHLLDVDDPLKLFPIQYSTIGTNDAARSKAYTASEQAHPRAEMPQVKNSTGTFSKRSVSEGEITMKDIALVVRSKNAGPFEVTLDILFDDLKHFNRVLDSGVLTSEIVQKLYGLKADDIVTLMFYKPALGWKCTFKRSWAQGSVGERDTFGAQQHAPLLNIVIPAIAQAS